MSQLNRATVLVVDDSSTVRNVIEKHLGDEYTVLQASDGEMAWQLIESNEEIALIFADLQMPVMNGMLLLKQVRESDCQRISQLPIIMITGHGDSEAAKQASYRLGATDFISKPFSALDIISSAHSYIQLNQKISTLESSSTHDGLTGLLNSHGLQEHGEKAIAGVLRHRFDTSILVLQIADMPQMVNQHGADITNKIIKSVAENIKQSLRQEETLAHCDDGKFVVILPMTKSFKAHIVALRIQKSVINFIFQLDNEKIRIRIAIGINSTEGHNKNLSFSDILDQGEKVLETSLSQRACKIVRHDEITTDNSSDEVNAGKENAAEVVDMPLSSNPNESSQSNAEVYGRVLLSIIEGDYASVSEEHAKALIGPMESFIAFRDKESGVEESN